MKLEQGDYLENNFRDEIRQLISNYETIWGKYIGHDGNSRMINVDGLSNTEIKDRINFSEYFYTCMESIICMNVIATECTTVDINAPKEYINLLNGFMSFQAHAGRVRDNALKLLRLHFTHERVQELMSQLEDVYQQRNQVLHGKKLPIRIEESLVLIAPPMGQEEGPEKWNSSMNWSEFLESNFTFISEYLESTVAQISQAYNNLAGNLIEPILKIVREKGINLDNEVNEVTTPVGISGFQGPISSSTPFSGGTPT